MKLSTRLVLSSLSVFVFSLILTPPEINAAPKPKVVDVRDLSSVFQLDWWPAPLGQVSRCDFS